MSRFLEFAAMLTAAGLATAAMAEPLGLGRAATDEEIAAWDIDIRPDGAGLPEGSGDVATGEEIYSERCAVCHGVFGEGIDRWPVLAGGRDTLKSTRPVKTVGSYWPYLSTVWDYVHRAMPFGDAQSLTNDEVYALTAYILYLNDIVDDEFELSNENFTEIHLPNEDGFYPDDRTETAIWEKRETCMSDCKDKVEITMRARVLDVTPDAASTDSGDAGVEATDGGPARADEGDAEEKVATSEEPKPDEDSAPDPALVVAGAKVFRKCRACHKVGDNARNGVGPKLNGVVGAKVASVEDYSYSSVLEEKASDGVVWSPDNLSAFLEKPSDWAKGTKMKFSGLRDEEDRQAVIEFLKSHTDK